MIRILEGDCRAVLASLPAESVHCVVTSPPYWGLRDYGVDGQIGLEATVDAWVAELVDVFRAVRRVLRDDGTVWLNLGDSYSTGTSAGRQDNSTADHGGWANGARMGGRRANVPGLKVKDLIGQPWLVAFALRADGWYLRQEIIWHKPNPMPESVRDRCTKAHEQIFLLSKSPWYYYDFEAMQEPVNGGAHARRPSNGVGFGHGYDAVVKPRFKTPDGWDTSIGEGGHGSYHRAGREKGYVPKVGRREGPPGNPAESKYGPLTGQDSDREHRTKANLNRKLALAGSGTKQNESYDAAIGALGLVETRNRRSVWTIPSAPFKEAHFATFPPALVEPCILAGCPIGGTVLDPFGGAGTTGLVADRLQRDAILIELNPAYAAMARQRVASDAPLFAEVNADASIEPVHVDVDASATQGAAA